MRKRFDSYKFYLCLIALTALFISFSEIKAEKFTFTRDKFEVVDNSKGSFLSGIDNNPNRYQYTRETPTYESVAMWHIQKLDLRKPFILDFKLRFSDTSHQDGADGFAFVMHQLSNNVIGSHGGYLGYGDTATYSDLIPSSSFLGNDSTNIGNFLHINQIISNPNYIYN